MESETPSNASARTLDYLSAEYEQHPTINASAVVSIACALAAVVFLVSLGTGVWQHFAPVVVMRAGWISGLLAVIAIFSGAAGALQAPRDSHWYRIAWLGYAIGMFIATLTPVFFLL